MASLNIYYNVKCLTESLKFSIAKTYIDGNPDINDQALNNVCPNDAGHTCDNDYYSIMIVNANPITLLDTGVTYTSDELRDKINELISYQQHNSER